MAAGANTSGQFAADVGYTKRPKHPKRPLAGEPWRAASEPKRKPKKPAKPKR